MAWYNPSTWSPVDNVQNKFSGAVGNVSYTPKAGTGFAGSGFSSSPVDTTRAGQAPVAPTATGGGGGGGGGGGTQQAAYVDPYAAWGGADAYNSLVNQFNSQHQNILGSAGEAGDAYGSQYGRGITTFLENARLGQNSLDLKGAKNELAKSQGVQGVLGMVGRGIKSAGVMLAGKNAGNSSAAGALASAYGDQGRRQLGSIGNQYEMGNQEIATDQNAFDVQQNQGVRELQGKKDDFINSTVLDARNQLAALDAQIAGASLPNRIAIDQEKEQVKQTLLQKLQGFDAQLNQGRAGIQASSVDQRRQAASDMQRAGQSLGADAFQYSTETPGQLQNTGPFASELPLFTLGKRRVA